MNPLGLLIRNLKCGMLGAVLIACGRVRRARKRALGPRVVTALYFHKPGAKLFLGCVRWLTKHGYTFISVGELIAFLDRRGLLPSGGVWLSLAEVGRGACRGRVEVSGGAGSFKKKTDKTCDGLRS